MITSAAEFVHLRASEDPAEYGRAARDRAPIQVWLDVIRDYPDYREWVAHNKTVPAEVLELLSRDANPAVRFVVAMKRSAPASVLEELATDPDEGVRHRVACNAKAPTNVLEILLTDESPAIREAASAKLAERR